LNETLRQKDRVISAQKSTNDNNNAHQAALRSKISNLEDKVKRLELALTNEKSQSEAAKHELSKYKTLLERAEKDK